MPLATFRSVLLWAVCPAAPAFEREPLGSPVTCSGIGQGLCEGGSVPFQSLVQTKVKDYHLAAASLTDDNLAALEDVQAAPPATDGNSTSSEGSSQFLPVDPAGGLPSVEDVFGGEIVSGAVEDLTSGVADQLARGHNSSQQALEELKARMQVELLREEAKQAEIERHLAQLRSQISILKYGNLGIAKEITAAQYDNGFMHQALIAMLPRAAMAVTFINESIGIVSSPELVDGALRALSATNDYDFPDGLLNVSSGGSVNSSTTLPPTPETAAPTALTTASVPATPAATPMLSAQAASTTQAMPLATPAQPATTTQAEQEATQAQPATTTQAEPEATPAQPATTTQAEPEATPAQPATTTQAESEVTQAQPASTTQAEPATATTPAALQATTVATTAVTPPPRTVTAEPIFMNAVNHEIRDAIAAAASTATSAVQRPVALPPLPVAGATVLLQQASAAGSHSQWWFWGNSEETQSETENSTQVGGPPNISTVGEAILEHNETKTQELVERLSARLASVRAMERDNEDEMKAQLQRRIQNGIFRSTEMQQAERELLEVQQQEVRLQHNLTAVRQGWNKSNEDLLEQLVGVKDFFNKVATVVGAALVRIGESNMSILHGLADEAARNQSQGLQLLQVGRQTPLDAFMAQAVLLKQRLVREEIDARANVSSVREGYAVRLKALNATNDVIVAANQYIHVQIENVEGSIRTHQEDIKWLQGRLELFKEVFLRLMLKFTSVESFLRDTAADDSALAYRTAVQAAVYSAAPTLVTNVSGQASTANSSSGETSYSPPATGGSGASSRGADTEGSADDSSTTTTGVPVPAPTAIPTASPTGLPSRGADYFSKAVLRDPENPLQVIQQPAPGMVDAVSGGPTVALPASAPAYSFAQTGTGGRVADVNASAAGTNASAAGASASAADANASAAGAGSSAAERFDLTFEMAQTPEELVRAFSSRVGLLEEHKLNALASLEASYTELAGAAVHNASELLGVQGKLNQTLLQAATTLRDVEITKLHMVSVDDILYKRMESIQNFAAKLAMALDVIVARLKSEVDFPQNAANLTDAVGNMSDPLDSKVSLLLKEVPADLATMARP